MRMPVICSAMQGCINLGDVGLLVYRKLRVQAFPQAAADDSATAQLHAHRAESQTVEDDCSANLGGLDIVEGWLDGDVEVYRFVTKPEMDKFVPKRLQKHFKGGALQYTDIIRYDPATIAEAPYTLGVQSIPPILAERVQSMFSSPAPALIACSRAQTLASALSFLPWLAAEHLSLAVPSLCMRAAPLSMLKV